MGKQKRRLRRLKKKTKKNRSSRKSQPRQRVMSRKGLGKGDRTTHERDQGSLLEGSAHPLEEMRGGSDVLKS